MSFDTFTQLPLLETTCSYFKRALAIGFVQNKSLFWNLLSLSLFFFSWLCGMLLGFCLLGFVFFCLFLRILTEKIKMLVCLFHSLISFPVDCVSMQGSANEQGPSAGWQALLYMGEGMMGIHSTNRFYQNVFWNVASETIALDFILIKKNKKIIF